MQHRPHQDPAVGFYTLKTVNGSSLPGNLGTTGGVSTEVFYEQLGINPDGTYLNQASLRLTQAGTVAMQDAEDSGRWRRNGSVVTFTVSTSNRSNTGSYTGTLDGYMLSLTQAGVVGVYEKSQGGDIGF